MTRTMSEFCPARAGLQQGSQGGAQEEVERALFPQQLKIPMPCIVVYKSCPLSPRTPSPHDKEGDDPLHIPGGAVVEGEISLCDSWVTTDGISQWGNPQPSFLVSIPSYHKAPFLIVGRPSAWLLG